MPANHRIPHTEETKAKIRASKIGRPATWRQRPSHVVGGITIYQCGRCKGFFSKDYFHKSNRNSLGIKSDCKDCHSVVSIASRDLDRSRASRRAAEARRRDRKLQSGSKVSDSDWLKLLEILDHRCVRCGNTDNITQDHVVPLSRGGLHHPTNIQALCRRCNEIKHTDTADYRTLDQRDRIANVWVIGFRRLESR